MNRMIKSRPDFPDRPSLKEGRRTILSWKLLVREVAPEPDTLSDTLSGGES